VNAAGNKIGDSAMTDADGNFKIQIDTTKTAVDTNATYKLVAVAPETDAAHVPGSPGIAGVAGAFYLSENLKVTENSTDKKVFGIGLPSAAGGCAEIANPNCDASVGLADLAILKRSFGKSAGEPGYEAYADFDGNGAVELADFVVLKKWYGKSMKTAPTSTPGTCLCKP
jgi:hypothetical protein